MMTNLDSLFDHLRTASAPHDLAAIEPRVLAGLAVQRERALSQRAWMLAGAISLVIGVSASAISADPARADPLFGVPTAAPSRLLVQ